MNEIESSFELNGYAMPNPLVEQAYYQIIRKVSDIISQVPSEDMRKHLIFGESNLYSHRLLSPLIMLRLSKDKEVISFAIDLELKSYLGRQQYHSLFRIIYECTQEFPDSLDQFEYWYNDYEEALNNPYAIKSLIEINEGR
ncbi:hypothetical protein WG906_08800 [Pedobacter sp. P351]|uniref:hypothetical protein n=1 Tax=Pedobacter superstes TaxID=3133441 RepID=UPI00309E1529